MIKTCFSGFLNATILIFSCYYLTVYFDRFARYDLLHAILVPLLIAFSGYLSIKNLLALRNPETGVSQRVPWYWGMLRFVALFLLLATWVFRPTPGMGEGPAGPAIDQTQFLKPWRTDPVLLLSIGDSVSTGFGAPKGHGFPDLMIQNVDAVFPETQGLDLKTALPGLVHRPLATNSSNSIKHQKVIADLTTQNADTFGIVTMTCGGIDLIHSYGKLAPKEGAMYGASFDEAKPWILNFETRLTAMMVELKEKFPGGLAVFIATIYDPTDGVGDIENAGPLFWLPKWDDGLEILTAFNAAIKSVAAKHDWVYVADVHATMLGHGIHCDNVDNPNYNANDPSYWYFRNLEDPNPRGHDAIRRTFLNAIVEAIGKK